MKKKYIQIKKAATIAENLLYINKINFFKVKKAIN